MTATGTDLDAQALVESALEHCVFPLAPAEDIARDGVRMWVKGEGVRVTDAAGREYLDMMSSHARANSLGYGNTEIADAVAEQLKTMHYAGTVNNMAPPTVKLADKLAELTPEGLS
jgi:adenosylmethionine-8-amino-7-oxononanoate aminotransferase